MERIKDVVVWNEENWIVDYEANMIYPENYDSVLRKNLHRYSEDVKYADFFNVRSISLSN